MRICLLFVGSLVWAAQMGCEQSEPTAVRQNALPTGSPGATSPSDSTTPSSSDALPPAPSPVHSPNPTAHPQTKDSVATSQNTPAVDSPTPEIEMKEKIVKGQSDPEKPAEGTSGETPSSVLDSKIAARMEVCNELTGHCRELAYNEPIPVAIPCEDRVVALEVVRESGAETVATCRPGVSSISDEELEKLLASPRAEPQPALVSTVSTQDGSGLVVERVQLREESEPAPLGTVFVREDLAIEIKRVVRSAEDIDPFCEGAKEEEECLQVHLEITNLRQDGGELRYDNGDFSLIGVEEDVVDQPSRTSSGIISQTVSVSIIPNRDPLVLQVGERLATSVVRRIPKNAGELVLEYEKAGPILFDLGTERDWSKTFADASEVAQRRDDLKHEMQCGFVFEYAKKATGDLESPYRKEDVVAICDPDVVAVLGDELNELRQLANSELDGRLGQTVLGDVLKDGDLAIRVLAVKRHATESTCSTADGTSGSSCVGIELEVTNLGIGNDAIWHKDGEYQLIDSNGNVFAQSPRNSAVSRYFGQQAGIPPGRRLTTRIVRYVPVDATDLKLVYVGRGKTSTLLLDENARSVAATTDHQLSPPINGMIAGPGNWLGNAPPVGVALDVYGFGVRVLEVERGWTPDEGCCEGTVPSTLLAFKLWHMMLGIDKAEADVVLGQLGDAATELEDDFEYVRVAIEVTHLGSPEERWEFNAAHLFLVDNERRVYLSGFYPSAERSLREPEFSPYGHGLFHGLRKSERVGELFGGSKIEEEIAWLVPRDAMGLTLVYVPWVHAAGGFLTLEESTGVKGSVEDDSWVEDALPVGATSESSPAPRGVAGAANEDVALRITQVERLPSPCFEGQQVLVGNECLRVAVQIASEPSEKPRTLFGHFKQVLIIDGREIPLFYDDRGYWNPEFDSFLDWAEINGRGVTTAFFRTEVPEGWSEGVFAYGRQGLDSVVYLSLNRP